MVTRVCLRHVFLRSVRDQTKPVAQLVLRTRLGLEDEGGSLQLSSSALVISRCHWEQFVPFRPQVGLTGFLPSQD